MMTTILIADDSAFQRKNIRRALQQDSYTILEASSGREALEMVDANPTDCILLDLIMPQEDGLSVLAALRDRGLAIPVIVITADVQTSTRQQCLDLGAAAVINKPQYGAELRAVIKAVLGL